MASEANTTFESVKERLDEIVDAVNDESLSLDDALDLYEEAVKLGMQASTLLEEGIAQQAYEGEDDEPTDDVPVSDEAQHAIEAESASAGAGEQPESAASQLQ